MKVAIVGTAPSTRNLAPCGDSEWEIWTCSPRLNLEHGEFSELPRISRFFEMHMIDGPELREALIPEHLSSYKEWLQKKASEFKVYTWPDQGIKGSVDYPLAELQEKYRDICEDSARYFETTVAYMLALAAYEGADEVHIYGCDMAQGTEYTIQRPTCEFWCGVLAGQGCKVYVPPQSDLLKCGRMYGLEGATALEVKRVTRLKEITEKKNIFEQQKQIHHTANAAAIGAMRELADLKHMLNGEGPPALVAKMENRVKALQREAQATAQQAQTAHDTIMAIVGAIEDLNYWGQWFGSPTEKIHA